MKSLRGNDGYFTPLFVLVVLAAAVYVGIHFAKPYYRYSAFKSDAAEMSRISLGDEKKLRAMIYSRAQELGIPIREDEIFVEKKSDSVMRVRAAWTESVNILDLYERDLAFSIDLTE